MLDLALPKIECERAAENYARFRIEPLEPGYGHTMGNALRTGLPAYDGTMSVLPCSRSDQSSTTRGAYQSKRPIDLDRIHCACTS